MKVFISWSGELSKECAELLSIWIKCTLQASEPWISSKDIDKGSLWFNEINDQLKETSVGIVCLTKDNKDKPWILFESGALAKGLKINKVCTFLINLKPADLGSPLSQFNHTQPNKEDIKGLLQTINKELEGHALEDKILDQVFDTYWPLFEGKFNEIIASNHQSETDAPPRSKDDILEEILYTTRTMDKRIRSLELGDRKTTSRKSLLTDLEKHTISSINALVKLGFGEDAIVEHLKNINNGVHFSHRELMNIINSAHESSLKNESVSFMEKE